MLLLPEFLTVGDDLQNMSFDTAKDNILNFAPTTEGDLLAALEHCRSLYNDH